MTDLNVKKLQPAAGYLLVEPAKQETTTKSGIILTEDSNEKPQYGTVLAVGAAACHCDESEKCDCQAPAQVGEQVIYKKWGGNEVKIGETEYQFLKFEDVLAIIKK